MVSREHGITRRRMLQLGVIAACGFGQSTALAHGTAQRCIFLNLVGGPSHLDTWDPKPHAPLEYRGPFQTIKTNIPGILISELFPRMAAMAHRYTIVRSIYHDAAPIHETGQQLIQCGRLLRENEVASASGLLLPGPIENTGVQLSHGQEGLHTSSSSSWRVEPRMQERYGQHAFGRACLQARQAIERGERFVTVNMFQTVYNSLSWDCHADGNELNVTLHDYKTKLAPMFDQTYTTLLADLHDRGLLDSTLVVAAGEFGRSPKINLRGGRDHWSGAWSVLFAGGGVPGGQVIGSTDRLGLAPATRPLHASAIANTIHAAMGHRHGEPIRELLTTLQS